MFVILDVTMGFKVVIVTFFQTGDTGVFDGFAVGSGREDTKLVKGRSTK